MKAVQVVFDETTLSHLDALDEVKQEGRSAVIRRLIEEFLKQRREEQIDEQYRRAYAGGDGLGSEWEGWTEEGAWPSD